MVAVHAPGPPFSRSMIPAQWGHSTSSPGLTLPGSGTAMPQSGQRTVCIRSHPQQPLEPAAVEADHDRIPHHNDRHGQAASSGDELLARRLVLGDVLALKRDTLLRKKLFRGVAGLSAR
jgi:hypothetical protein